MRSRSFQGVYSESSAQEDFVAQQKKSEDKADIALMQAARPLSGAPMRAPIAPFSARRIGLPAVYDNRAESREDHGEKVVRFPERGASRRATLVTGCRLVTSIESMMHGDKRLVGLRDVDNPTDRQMRGQEQEAAARPPAAQESRGRAEGEHGWADRLRGARAFRTKLRLRHAERERRAPPGRVAALLTAAGARTSFTAIFARVRARAARRLALRGTKTATAAAGRPTTARRPARLLLSLNFARRPPSSPRRSAARGETPGPRGCARPADERGPR